jgi:hypothetical protein
MLLFEQSMLYKCGFFLYLHLFVDRKLLLYDAFHFLSKLIFGYRRLSLRYMHLFQWVLSGFLDLSMFVTLVHETMCSVRKGEKARLHVLQEQIWSMSGVRVEQE